MRMTGCGPTPSSSPKKLRPRPTRRSERNASSSASPPAAPQLELGWRARSPGYADQNRRVELHKLAGTRLAALTKIAKTAIQAAALETETQLLLGGLESSEARQFLAAMPTVEQLMPPLSLDDLGVTRWQPPEDAAAQLTTPMSATDRRRRQIRRAIQANPHASDREIAEIVGCATRRSPRTGDSPWRYQVVGYDPHRLANRVATAGAGSNHYFLINPVRSDTAKRGRADEITRLADLPVEIDGTRTATRPSRRSAASPSSCRRRSARPRWG